MKVLTILIIVFVFVSLLLVTTSESKSLLFKKIRISPNFFFGVLLGSASTIMYHYLIIETGMYRVCRYGYYESNVHSRSSFKLENETLSFTNLIASTSNNSTQNYSDGTELTDILGKHIRILCLVLTHPGNHQTQARAVRETWGRKCSVFYFVSTKKVLLENDPSAATVIYEGRESRSTLWAKVKTGFKHAYDNHFDDVDWFLKADDDSYMIMENLRSFLLDKDTSLPVLYGNRQDKLSRSNLRKNWITGGSGYILSKEALRRFAEEAFDSKSFCNKIDFALEDLAMSSCLGSANVEIGDARDGEGKPRFLHTALDQVVNENYRKVSREFVTSLDVYQYGKNCCSDSMIGMHYVQENVMRIVDFLIYNVHPFEINSKFSSVNQKNEIELYLKNKTINTIISKNLNPKFPIVLGKYEKFD